MTKNAPDGFTVWGFFFLPINFFTLDKITALCNNRGKSPRAHRGKEEKELKVMFNPPVNEFCGARLADATTLPRYVPYLNLVKAFAAFSLAVLSALPANAQLIHSYTFSNGVNDSVGGANGTLLNGAAVSDGVLTLDGSNDYVQIGQKIVPTSGSYSVTLFALQNQVRSGFIELISQGFSGGPGFYIGFSANGDLRATDSWLSTGVQIPSAGIWHHYALVVGGGSSRLFVDGTLRATLASAISTTSSGSDTRFGRQFGGFSEFFNGSLDDISVYGSALSASQVAALAAAGPSVGVAAPEPGTAGLLMTVAGVPFAAMILRRRK